MRQVAAGLLSLESSRETAKNATSFSGSWLPMRLALFEPDIPPNLGTILRLGACLETPVHVIEPCGFPFSVQAVRRSAMDYLEHAEIHHPDGWPQFQPDRPAGRLARNRVV